MAGRNCSRGMQACTGARGFDCCIRRWCKCGRSLQSGRWSQSRAVSAGGIMNAPACVGVCGKSVGQAACACADRFC